MTVSRFYPYQTAPEGVALRVASSDPTTASADDGSLRATDQELDELILELELSVSDATYEKVLPPSASPIEDTNLVVIARSTESRRREAYQVGDDGSVVLALKRNEWVGLVELFGALVRSRDASDSTGFAMHRGALIAWSDVVSLRFDEPPDRRGDNLPVTWIKFSERPDLRSNLEHLFAVDPGNPPELLLNSDVDQLSEVLDNKGTHGVKPRIRDAVFMQIAHQVWTSLLSTALASMEDQAAPAMATGEEVLEELAPWEAAVIRRWASDLFPGQDAESLLDVVLEEVTGPNVSELHLVRIPRAVQKKMETYKSFDGLVKDTGLRRAIERSQS